jgi:hypothetical protein
MGGIHQESEILDVSHPIPKNHQGNRKQSLENKTDRSNKKELRKLLEPLEERLQLDRNLMRWLA